MPAKLPVGEPYWIAGNPDNAMLSRIESIIAWASPLARYQGPGNTPAPNGTIILFEPDFLDRAAAFIREGVAPERIRCMPIPENYPWAFWDVWGWFDPRPDLRAQIASFAAYKHAVEACSYLGGAKMASRVNDWQSLAESHLYWGQHREQLNSHKADMEKVSQRLADDHSREIFDLVLRSDPQELWTHFTHTVFRACDYLEHDGPRPGETVLNLGVFSGHELPYFLALVDNGIIHNLDPLGHDLLSDYARKTLSTRPHNVRESRIAAGATHKMEYFKLYADGQMCLSSKGTPGADIIFYIQPLDEYVEVQKIEKVHFIKIDIEGMEPDALTGLQKTVQRDRPTLSLAIYHAPEHLWSLPLRLMSELENYDFYIDHFSPVRWETVLTAVPKERASYK
ncbi:MAG: FkbM family methyltransferase [Alphaproteobacteria bacterium]|nr:FkbM family methyltransferase [Alphaproteobacteria bacterium]